MINTIKSLLGNSNLSKIQPFDFSMLEIPQMISFFLHCFIQEKKEYLLVVETRQLAEDFYQILNSQENASPIRLYLGHDHKLYSSILSSEGLLQQRLQILYALFLQKKNGQQSFPLITTLEDLFLLTPPVSFFEEHYHPIHVEDILSPQDLISLLQRYGYIQAPIVDSPGTYCLKGEILDFYAHEGPVRLSYFDEIIESIYLIDEENNKTIKNSPLSLIHPLPSSHVFAYRQSNFASTFRNRLPLASSQQRFFQQWRQQTLSNLESGILFPQYPLFAPLFFQQNDTLLSFWDEKIPLLLAFSDDLKIEEIPLIDDF